MGVCNGDRLLHDRAIVHLRLLLSCHPSATGLVVFTYALVFDSVLCDSMATVAANCLVDASKQSLNEDS